MTLTATAWVQASVEYQMVAETVYDRASDRLGRLVTDPEALADPDHRPAARGVGPEKVAVVMDVDQTILDDSPYVVRLVSSGRWHDQAAEEEWAAWCRQAAAMAFSFGPISSEAIGLGVVLAQINFAPVAFSLPTMISSRFA